MYTPHSKPYIQAEFVTTIAENISRGLLARGEGVNQFTERLSNYLHGNKVFLTPSGTAAIFLSLKALGLKEGDEIVLPTYVCYSVAEAICLAGGKPIFCDIGNNWVMNTETVGRVLTSKTKAIIVVHIFGIYADIKAFKKFELPIIEDCCQCFTYCVNNQPVGTESDFVVYSFQATKCLTTGEGGALTCNNENMLPKMEEIYIAYKHVFTFTDIQASLGLSQLNIYDSMLKKRREIAAHYFDSLRPDLTQALRDAGTSIYFRFVLRSNADFNTIRKKFDINGIAVRKGVDELLHIRYGVSGQFENAERIFESTISIPIYPALTENQTQKIASVTNLLLS